MTDEAELKADYESDLINLARQELRDVRLSHRPRKLPYYEELIGHVERARDTRPTPDSGLAEDGFEPDLDAFKAHLDAAEKRMREHYDSVPAKTDNPLVRALVQYQLDVHFDCAPHVLEDISDKMFEAATALRQPKAEALVGIARQIDDALIEGVGQGRVDAQGKAMDILSAFKDALRQPRADALVEVSVRYGIAWKTKPPVMDGYQIFKSIDDAVKLVSGYVERGGEFVSLKRIETRISDVSDQVKAALSPSQGDGT